MIDFSRTNILFTDVDDTLTTAGKLLPETYQSLCDLANAGIDVIPVTGGCAGWCDQIVRTWPVRAVIGEGGAFYLEHSEQQGYRRVYWGEARQHAEDQQRIKNYIAQLNFDFDVRLANDQDFRLVDVAIDYNQDQHLNKEQVYLLVSKLTQAGFNVRQSSIHLNVWIGNFDKRAMSERLGFDLLGLSPEALCHQSVFIGDAPNDESMFNWFPNTVGVANIQKHLDKLQTKPVWITKNISGLGFTEMASAWLADRN